MAAAWPAWRAARATGVRLLVGEGGMKRQRRGGRGNGENVTFLNGFSAPTDLFSERRTDGRTPFQNN